MYICIYIHTYLDLSTSIYSGQQELPGNQNGNDATGYPKEVATVPLLKLAKEEARPLSLSALFAQSASIFFWFCQMSGTTVLLPSASEECHLASPSGSRARVASLAFAISP